MTWDPMVNLSKTKILTVIDDDEQRVQVTLGRFFVEVENSDDLADVEDAMQKAVNVLPRGDRTWDEISGVIAQECEARGWKLIDCSDYEIECYA